MNDPAIALDRISDRTAKVGRPISEAALVESTLSAQIADLSERLLDETINPRQLDALLAMHEAATDLIVQYAATAIAQAERLKAEIQRARQELLQPIKSERPTVEGSGVQDHGGNRESRTE
jgi:hypothetical protein